ncbi:MAG TPA: hypothetical protein VKA07_09975 [Candidatus Sulfotelmatobacter sp.]|nr:hypothetical protein [Candidatus Sulfotelmatobacter sp.]
MTVTSYLRHLVTLLYAAGTVFHDSWRNMHRLTARLLLLFALAGSILPLAQAVTASPVPECCRRMGAHHCQDASAASASASGSSQASFRAPGCCHGDCGRAVTTAQWAHLQLIANDPFARNIDARIVASNPHAPDAIRAASPSTRAPPLLSIA